MKPVTLVVDDEEANRDILARYLKRWGYFVQTASGGLDALEFMAENRVDLVLLDLLMPEMDGFEVLERIKKNPTLKTIPVLILTAVRDAKTLVRGLECGAADYVTKPFQELELKARVRAHIRQQEGVVQRAKSEKLMSLSQLTLGILAEVKKVLSDAEPHLIVIQEMGGEDEKLSNAGREIRKSLKTLPDLIDHLSDYVLASVEDSTAINWLRLVDRVSVLTALGREQRGDVLEWEIPSHLPIVMAQFNQLCQILVCLINRLELSLNPGGVIRLTTRPVGDEIFLEVSAPDPGQDNPEADSRLEHLQPILEGNRARLERVDDAERLIYRVTLPTSSIEGVDSVPISHDSFIGSTADSEDQTAIPEFVQDDEDGLGDDPEA